MGSCAESQLEGGSGAPASSPQVPTVPAYPGEEKVLFLLGQGAGDKGTEPTSASDHTQAPAAPKVSSGTRARRWLPPPPSNTLHSASSMLSPGLLCSLEIWLARLSPLSHLDSPPRAPNSVTVLSAGNDQRQLGTTRPKPNSQSPPPPAPGNGNSVLLASQGQTPGVNLDSPPLLPAHPSARPMDPGVRIQHTRRGRLGPASRSVPQDIATASSVVFWLPQFYPCPLQISLHLAAKRIVGGCHSSAQNLPTTSHVTKEKTKSLCDPTQNT